ncbi:MAG: MarR family transcriptional regulator [Tissierellia bacterium]|nr:MarR family transcriptional regulator [Tissierellia bacterium]
MQNYKKENGLFFICLSRTSSMIFRKIEKELIKYDLTLTQFAILEALVHKGSMPVGKIMNTILSTPGNVPFVIANLIKKGYVKKVCDPKDRRFHIVSITKKGEDAYKITEGIHNQVLNEFLEPLDRDQKLYISRMLKKLL